jgi:hypothetical protein
VFSLSGTKNLRLQPERYAKEKPDFFGMYFVPPSMAALITFLENKYF